MHYFLSALRKFTDFSGRSRRSEYWYFVLFNSLFGFTLLFLSGMAVMIGGSDPGLFINVIYIVYSLIMFIPSLAVSVRRLHDTGRSGWYMLFVFIPVVGSVLLIVWMATDSDWGDNQYGKYPKEEFNHLIRI